MTDERKLTLEKVKLATKKQLEEDTTLGGFTTLFWASSTSTIEIVEAILDKGVDIDAMFWTTN
jgi:hypothetical protein